MFQHNTPQELISLWLFITGSQANKLANRTTCSSCLNIKWGTGDILGLKHDHKTTGLQDHRPAVTQTTRPQDFRLQDPRTKYYRSTGLQNHGLQDHRTKDFKSIGLETSRPQAIDYTTTGPQHYRAKWLLEPRGHSFRHCQSGEVLHKCKYCVQEIFSVLGTQQFLSGSCYTCNVSTLFTNFLQWLWQVNTWKIITDWWIWVL